MKKIAKNIVIILICLMLAFAQAVAKPREEVKAVVLTTAIVYGGYALGSLVLGGLGYAAINEDFRNSVVETSKKVFIDAPATIISGIADDIQTAVANGEMAVRFGAGVWDWLQDQAMNSVLQDLLKLMPAAVVDFNEMTIVDSSYTSLYDQTWVLTKLDNPYSFATRPGVFYTHMIYEANPDLTPAVRANGNTATRLAHTWYEGSYHRIHTSMLQPSGTVEDLFVLDGAGVPIGYTYSLDMTVDGDIKQAVDHWADQVGNRVDRIFERSKAQGKMNVPLAGLPALGANGQALEYDLDSGNWITSSTGEVYVGDIALDGKQVGVITDGKGAIALDGDVPRVGVRAGARAGQGRVTDVVTGEVVGTVPIGVPIDGSWDIPNVANPPIDVPVPTIPDFTVPKTGAPAINLTPLAMAGTTFTKKFPFSIPWDLQSQFAIFNVQPQTPVFSVDTSFNLMGVTTIPVDFDIDLTPFNVVAVVTRWALIIVFDVGLIMAIRRFMPE